MTINKIVDARGRLLQEKVSDGARLGQLYATRGQPEEAIRYKARPAPITWVNFMTLSLMNPPSAVSLLSRKLNS